MLLGFLSTFASLGHFANKIIQLSNDKLFDIYKSLIVGYFIHFIASTSLLRNNGYKQRKGLEMKQLPIILLVASITLVNVLAATVVISKVNTRADAIDAKLLELDSRRNAQYGIIKKCVADPQKCEGK